MTNEADGDPNSDDTTGILAVPLGLLAGVVLGMLVGNIALGLALGLITGVAVSAISAAMHPRRRANTSES